jgi:hypothetical protein
MVVERVNSSQKLLAVGEKGLYSSYTIRNCSQLTHPLCTGRLGVHSGIYSGNRGFLQERSVACAISSLPVPCRKLTPCKP